MNKFPPLNTWFEVRLNVTNAYSYTRHDLRLKPGLSNKDLLQLPNEIALLIARLRLTEFEYKTWLEYWGNRKTIPANMKKRFNDRFWHSFVSTEATEKAGGEICPDLVALQGHIGELFLYLIQKQYSVQQIAVIPKKPKEYSKDSGIDCLELCGVPAKRHSMHYIVWESKAIFSSSLGKYPGKIYDQHIYATPKSFKEMVDQLADIYDDNPELSDFVNDMIDDFYSQRPSQKKCFGGCISYNSSTFASPTAFSTFAARFRTDLAPLARCRQVRLCAVEKLPSITKQVWRNIWTKLLP